MIIVPRVWLTVEEYGMGMYTEPQSDGMPVDMNASLYRQIRAAEKQYDKFQGIMEKFYMEAVEHPDKIRRVK